MSVGDVTSRTRHRTFFRRAMLLCGAASTLLYIGVDSLASTRYEGYSYRNQTISELSAVDAPTRSLWVPLSFVYSLIVGAGSAGVWASAGEKLALRIVGGLLACMGVLGLIAWPLAPMHKREVLARGGATRTDTMHLVLSGLNTLIFMLCIALGAGAFGKRFRRYSIATLGAVSVSGALTGLDAPKVSANEPTPWLGIKERIAVFGSMLWISVLAIALWGKERC